MNIHPDFEELLRLPEDHGVEYMIRRKTFPESLNC